MRRARIPFREISRNNNSISLHFTLASVSAYFRGLDYLVWAPTRSQSTPSHHIIIRFKTYLESGILFTTGSIKDFLVIEIYDGKLRLAIELGGGNFFQYSI